VLNTYLVYLRFQLMRGYLTPEDYATEIANVRSLLSAANAPAHLVEYNSLWK